MPNTFDASAILRPSVFIGSSSTKEAKDVALLLEADLRDNGIDAVVWAHDVFQLGHHTLSELIRILRCYDFGVVVFWPDDELVVRGTAYKATRDNVVLELGMFLGALGPDRAFILRDRNTTRWLSDLAGLGIAEFTAGANLRAAAGAAIMDIREAIRGRSPQCIRDHEFSNLDQAHLYMSALLNQGEVNTIRQASLSKFPYGATRYSKQFTGDVTNFVAKDENAYCYVYNPVVSTRRARVEDLLGKNGSARLNVRELTGELPDDTRNFILFDNREVVVVEARGGHLPNRMRLHRRPEVVQFYESQFQALFALGKTPPYWPATGA